MSIEAVLLTGGASKRMGQDKASLVLNGVPIAEILIKKLESSVSIVTVLGRDEISGTQFLEDKEEYRGPLNALKKFNPQADSVFVCSCDMPLFDPAIIGLCENELSLADVCAPIVDGVIQPLCALYRNDCFEKMAACKSNSMMGFLDNVNVKSLEESLLTKHHIDIRSFKGANTPEELAALLNGDKKSE